MPGIKASLSHSSAQAGILTHQDHAFSEENFFTDLCEELKNNFKRYYGGYFCTSKAKVEMENALIEVIFVRSIINDILATEKYTIAEVAYATDIPEAMVYELLAGKISMLTPEPLKRLISLHRAAKPRLHQEIHQRISTRSAQ